MTKLFLRMNTEYFDNIFDKLKNDIEVYEILTHIHYGNIGKTKESAIKCIEDDEIFHLRGLALCGWEYEDNDLIKYQKEIKSHVLENDDIIVIFTEDIFNGYPFYNSFLKFQSEINFHVHAVMLTYSKKRDIKNDTGFLRMIPNVDKCDSVTVFNIADLADLGDRGWRWYVPSDQEEKEKNDLLTINEIFEDELVEILRKTDFSKLHSDDKSVFVYNHNASAFENHVLKDFEIVNPNLYEDEIQEFITPNKGRETCRYLRALRRKFIKTHHLKEKEEVCTYSGECMGTCRKCDWDSENLWQKVYDKNHNKFGYDSKNENRCTKAEICGVNRLRMGTDGEGVRSLVVFDKCPLNCKYCINKSFVNQLPTIKKISVSELLGMLKKDLVYFEETGGGVTFGGGEPLLYADFISAFKKEYPFIHTAVQTSLNTDFYAVEKLVPYIDEWYIDIKDMNNGIYRAYTGRDNYNVIENLKMLVKLTDKNKIICRVPHIPNYNTPDDVKSSVSRLKEIGVVKTEEFEYIE